MSLAIVRAFIALKRLALRQKSFASKLEDIRNELSGRIDKHDAQLAAVYIAIEKLLEDKQKRRNWEERERVGFKPKG